MAKIYVISLLCDYVVPAKKSTFEFFRTLAIFFYSKYVFFLVTEAFNISSSIIVVIFLDASILQPFVLYINFHGRLVVHFLYPCSYLFFLSMLRFKISLW